MPNRLIYDNVIKMKFPNPFSKKQPTHAELLAKNIASGEMQAYGDYSHKPYPSVYDSWDGERNYGDLGFPINYTPDFRNLAIRSWQSFYESDITQIIIKNYLLWVVGKGLTLNSEPLEKYIKKIYPDFSRDNFTDEIEDMWQLFASSKRASFSEMQDLHQIAFEACLNAIVGGDVLVIMRYDGNYPTVQLIDGLHIMNPTSGVWAEQARIAGNTIKEGVEVDKKGKHIAFYVQDDKGGFERIAAFNTKTKRPMAWLMYGFKYRLNDRRGMPLFAVVLEELKKLGRYKDATVSSAEENAKVAFTIEHDKDGSGENIFTNAVKQASLSGQPTVPESSRGTGDTLATRIAMTTNKQAFNLPPGASLHAHKNEAEISFKDFFSTNFDIICATMGVAPEVAMSRFNSNYSASRMASKMTEFKFRVDRDTFAKEFYKPIYEFWLDTRVLLGKINTPGYITSMIKGDYEMIAAFKTSEFIGVNMPHVDPVKEVNAEVLKINNLLTTREKAARDLGVGDWHQNIENLRQENEKAKDLLPQPNNEQNGQTTTGKK